jgi:transcriptional regulatory protein RtcR
MALTVLGFLGTTLDTGRGPTRWERWRPTVSLFQHEDLLVDRLLLLFPEGWEELCDTVCGDIGRLSPETEVVRIPMALVNAWDFEEVYAALHDVAHAVSVEDDDELWVHITTGTHVAQICLFLLTEAHFFPGKLLQTRPGRGAHKAPGSYDLIDLDLQRYDAIASRFEAERAAATGVLKAGIETRNPAFNHLIDQIERVVVASDAPILLMGATGAGKSELARRIDALKRTRRAVAGPLVEVNCATLRGDSAMSALFGHERGAFTGAIGAREGLLRRADGGVLFLDEVGELGLDEQAMLLRAIELGTFLPVGSDHEVRSRFALIAGTNRDLHVAVQQGHFRADLLARIDLWTFRLPSLRERPEDVEPNLDHELARFAKLHGRRVRFTVEARQRFQRWGTTEARWEGNFRDLGAAVTRMGTLADGGRIHVADVDAEIARLSKRGGTTASRSLVDSLLPETVLDDFDRVQLEAVLAVCVDSRTLADAGRKLFAVSRTRRKSINDADRLRKYLAKFGISRADIDTLR